MPNEKVGLKNIFHFALAFSNFTDYVYGVGEKRSAEHSNKEAKTHSGTKWQNAYRH
jgi:hypothetical protein